MDHATTIQELGEGVGKAVGTMDPLQHATEAADLHEWEMSLRSAAPRAGAGTSQRRPAR